LNTPLPTLSGSLQLTRHLAEDSSGDPRLGRHLDLAIGQAKLLGDLVRDLTDIVWLQEGKFQLKPERTDLGRVVGVSVEIMRAQEGGHGIRYQPPPDPILLDAVTRAACNGCW